MLHCRRKIPNRLRMKNGLVLTGDVVQQTILDAVLSTRALLDVESYIGVNLRPINLCVVMHRHPVP